MSTKRGEFALRFTTEATDKVRADLKAMGDEGKRALQLIGDGGERADAALDGASKKAKDLREQAGENLQKAANDSSLSVGRLVKQIAGLNDQQKLELAQPIETFVQSVNKADVRTETWARNVRVAFDQMRNDLDKLAMQADNVDLANVSARASSLFGSDLSAFNDVTNALNQQVKAEWTEDMVRETRRAANEMEEFADRSKEASEDVGKLDSKSDRAARKVKKLGAESVKAGPGLKAISGVASDMKDELEGLTSRIPVIGGGLKALGGVGTVAAVGLAAAAAALAAIQINGRRAMKEIGRIVTTADNVSVAVEAMQALEAEASAAGVPAAQLASTMQNLSNMSVQAAAGQGSLYTMLKDVNPELVKQISTAGTQAERWNVLSRAVRGASSETEKQLIAQAAFGAQGVQMLRMLDTQVGSIEELTEKWKSAGYVLDEDLVRRVDEADTKFDLLSKRMNINVTYAFSSFASEITGAQGLLVGLTDEFVEFVDQFKALEDRSGFSLDRDLERLEFGLKNVQREGETLDVVREKLEALQKARGERGFFEGFFDDYQGSGATWLSGVDEPAPDEQELSRLEHLVKLLEKRADIQAILNDREAEAKKLQAEREKEEEALQARLAAIERQKAWETENNQARQRAIQLLAELGDHSLQLAQYEAELNKVREYGFITLEQQNTLMARYRDQINGTTEALRMWQGVVEQAKTPVERLSDKIDELNMAYRAGLVSPQLYAKALAALEAQLKDATEAADKQTDAEKAAEKVREKLKKAAHELLSAEEKLAREAGRLNALVQAQALTMDEARAAYALYEKELKEAAKETENLRLQNELLDEIFMSQMDSIEDVGEIFIATLKRMVLESIKANREIASEQGLGGFLSAIFNGVSSNFGFGSGQPSASGHAGSSNSVPLVHGVELHTGGDPSDETVRRRSVVASVFNGAPRHHKGINLAADEHAAILQDDENVLSADHNERLVQAVERLVAGRQQALGLQQGLFRVDDALQALSTRMIELKQQPTQSENALWLARHFETRGPSAPGDAGSAMSGWSVRDQEAPVYRQAASSGAEPGAREGDVIVNVYGAKEDEVSVQSSRNGGSRQFDIFLRQQMASAAGKGAFDQVFSSRYGIKPGVKSRG